MAGSSPVIRSRIQKGWLQPSFFVFSCEFKRRTPQIAVFGNLVSVRLRVKGIVLTKGARRGSEPRNPLQRKSTDLSGRCFFFGVLRGIRTRLKEFGNAKFFVNSRKRVRGSSPVIMKTPSLPRWRQTGRALVTKGSAVLFWRFPGREPRNYDSPVSCATYTSSVCPFGQPPSPQGEGSQDLRCGVLPFTAF